MCQFSITFVVLSRCSHCNLLQIKETTIEVRECVNASTDNSNSSIDTSRSRPGSSRKIPESPPPAYEKINHFKYCGVHLVSGAENEELAIPGMFVNGSYFSNA